MREWTGIHPPLCVFDFDLTHDLFGDRSRRPSGCNEV
jgi:hypothetical protein